MKVLQRYRRLPRLIGPATVTLGLAGRISVGRDFALALRSAGIVFAWGSNRFGQVGNGEMSFSPVSVPVKVTGLSQVTGISAGRDSSIATENSGISAVTSVWAWGANDDGQLGDGTTVGRSTPERVTGLPVSIASISAGGGHMLALRSDGTVLGWGFNVRGQLGNGIQTQVSGPVQVTNLAGATQVAAGTLSSYAIHTVLVLAGQGS